MFLPTVVISDRFLCDKKCSAVSGISGSQRVVEWVGSKIGLAQSI